MPAKALRLLAEHSQEYPTVTAAAEAIARKVGVGTELVRRWSTQADIDAGSRPGTTSEESAEIKRLSRESAVA